jgi:hypothetical protein
MTKPLIGTLLLVALMTATPAVLQAENQYEDEYAQMQQSQQEIEQMFSDIGDYIAEARFDEDDIKSLLEHWQEWDQFGSEQDDGDEDEPIDFKSILADSAYLDWTASHGLDAEDWMRKSLRITMSLYRDRMMMAAQAMPAQMDEQLQMLEEQRAQLGEEMYQQFKQGLEAATQYGSAIMDSARHLPEPTASERALLEKYSDQLAILMEPGDDEFEEYDQYDGDEDYDE